MVYAGIFQIFQIFLLYCFPAQSTEKFSKTLSVKKCLFNIQIPVSAGRPSGRPLRLGLVEFFRVFFFVLFFQ